ncbi:MAG: sugar phosphate isomerase/epimerase [Clostridia bacterium]|nr:sugar phosphate isomerase/epimerase [Clostridia bacterium]
MKYGICTSAEVAAKAKQCGYDYIEPALQMVANMSEEEFDIFLETMKAADMKCLAMCGFFPATLKLVGDEAHFEKIKSYIDFSLSRAAKLGAETVVFGSGAARTIPLGSDREKCTRQLIDAISYAGNVAAKYGITIVIEPLNANETNMATTVSEAVEFVDKVNLPNVKTMVDFHHFHIMKEDYSVLFEVKDYLAHMHIARGTADRGVPHLESDREYLEEVFGVINQLGYDGTLTIEAIYKDFETEMVEAIKIFKEVNA